jgi:TolB-like protein
MIYCTEHTYQFEYIHFKEKPTAFVELFRTWMINRGGAVKKELEESEITGDEIRSACDSILKSKIFLKAHRMRRLLIFLIDQALAGDKGNTSEYAIGIKVFDRNPLDYVSEDPAVRVQVGRLRQRLAAYYLDQTSYDNIKISIPIGRHTPTFCRIKRSEKRSEQDGYLMIQPIRHIAECREGQAFASGLYEELLNQLFSSFGDVFTWATLPATTATGGIDVVHGHEHTGLHHLIEGSVRVDAERIRASIRLVDHSVSRITWAKHFDRSVQFGIRAQEELATSICNALREVVRQFQTPCTT